MLNDKKTFGKGSGAGIRGRILWLAAAFMLVAASMLLLRMSYSENGYSFPVYINEVLASNTSHPNPEGRCCDYMELYNSADYPVDLTGFQLGDIAGSSRYAFPAGTTIPAGGYLVVYCDKTVEDPYYAQFAISRAGGEAFYLIASNNAIVDSVVTVATDPDQAMVRLDAQRWGISSLLTPGWKNGQEPDSSVDIYNPQISPVRISELSAAGNGFVKELGVLCDWVELYNTSGQEVDISGFVLSDNMGNDKYRFPEGTVVPGFGYWVVYCKDDISHPSIAPFGISQYGGESLVLKNSQGQIAEIVDILPMEDGGSMEVDGTGTWRVTRESSPGHENSHKGHEAFLRSIGAYEGAVVISELMAGSQCVLADKEGEFTDWVELYNTTDHTIDLTGWFLSDDPHHVDKWSFPSLTVEAGARIVIFCSGKGNCPSGEIHTDFSLSSGGESLILSAYVGNTVDAVSYGEAEEGTAFIFPEGTQTQHPTPGFSNDGEGYEMFCDSRGSTGPLAIWELMSSNDKYLPQALGECCDWVELRNVSSEDVLLSDYAISDDPEIRDMYTLPQQTLKPGESIVVLLSEDPGLSGGKYANAGFSLNVLGDALFLFTKSGELQDFVSFGQIPNDMSYGRDEAGGGFFYMQPTPGKENQAGSRLISAEPVGNFIPGVYTGDAGFTVTLEAVGEIYYTLDGSDPDSGSLPYTGPVDIEKTAVLRAVAVEEGKLKSGIYTATFVIGQSHALPVVSLVTDPDNLWDKKQGIYKNGDMDIKEEKRPANVSYTGPDGSFSLDCELSLHGATTVTAFNKKSFTVRFQDNYDGPLYYDVFGDGEVTAFRSLIIRTSHESTFSTQMHDALMGQVASECSDTLLAQKHKYVALYLNGEYWGLYALREHHSVEHYASYMHVPVDSVHMSKNYTEYGTSLYSLYKFCGKNDLRSDENYAYAESLLDMESFADWIIFQSYAGNLDINGNMRYYYCAEDGLWRCGLVDLDLGMMAKGAFEKVADTFHHGRIMGSLMENEKFQHLLATRLAELLAGPLSDESMIAQIDEMAAVIRPETVYEEERWGTPVRNWEILVEHLKDYCDGRSDRMIRSLCDLANFTREEKKAYFGELLE